MTRAAVLILTLALTSAAADDRAAAAFLRDLQRAVSRDDRAAVAALIRYPITVFAGPARVPIADPAALVERYDLIFNAAMKTAIGETRSMAAVANAYAIDRFLTVEPVAGGLRITAIAVPLEETASTRGAPPARFASPRPRRPQRVIVRGGTSELAGVLASGATESYVTWAAKNQLLDVRINGVRGREVVARVLDAKNLTPLDARTRDGVRTWTGRVPATGDYQIDVVCTARNGEPIAYRLVITLR